MLRWYVSQIIGSGSNTDSFRPVLADIVNGAHWNVAGRPENAVAGGFMLVSADVSDVQHAALIADARISALPLENASDVPLPVDALIGDIPLAKRQTLQTRSEARHIPIHDLTLTHTVRDYLKRVIRRMIMRGRLAALDYTEGLDTTLGQIATTRRNNIRNRLIALGYDVSRLTNSTTLRAALADLLSQGGPHNQTHLD